MTHVNTLTGSYPQDKEGAVSPKEDNIEVRGCCCATLQRHV